MGLVKLLSNETIFNNTNPRLTDVLGILKKEAIKYKDCFIGGLYVGTTVLLEANPSKLHKTTYEGWVYDRETTDSNLRKKGIDYLLKYKSGEDDQALDDMHSRKTLRKKGVGYLLIQTQKDDNKLLNDIMITESIYLSGALIGLSACLIYGACLLINREYKEIKKNFGIKK